MCLSEPMPVVSLLGKRRRCWRRRPGGGAARGGIDYYGIIEPGRGSTETFVYKLLDQRPFSGQINFWRGEGVALRECSRLIGVAQPLARG